MSTVQAFEPKPAANTGVVDLGAVAMGNEDHPGPTRTGATVDPGAQTRPGAARNPFAERTVNLSEVPGRKAADNYVGITQKSADGSTRTTEVRLQAVIKQVGQETVVVRIVAVGPVIKNDGRLESERSKTYVVKDAQGQLVTDPALVRPRVIKMLQNQGMTSVSVADRVRIDAATARRSDIAAHLRSVGPTVMKAPGIDYSPAAGKPNRMQGKTPAPRSVERTGFNVSWQTESKGVEGGRPTVSAMVVPNVVGEVGITKTGPAGSVTVQPLTGFFPVSGGNGENYRQTTDRKALVRSTVHPAGFYPGDAGAEKWAQALKDYPTMVPEIRTSSWGESARIRTDDWYQVYVNIPNLATPLTGASINARSIATRTEVRGTLYTQTDITAGRENTQFVAAPYAWGQAHVKLGLADVVKPGRNAYAKLGAQGEVGVYVYNSTSPLSSLGAVDRNTLRAKDWHIVNGSITDRREAFLQQFSGIEKTTGLKMLSESVVPDWGDRNAGVYVRTPATPEGGSADWQSMKARALIVSEGQRYVPVADMARLLNRAGREMPKYKELGFVSGAELLRLNADRVQTIKHPGTGKSIQVFKSDTWVNTSARVSVGGPGLFLPADVAPGK